MIKTAMLWVHSWSKNGIFSYRRRRYVEFNDMSCADLKCFYKNYKSTELTILLYDQPKEPLQYLCNKLGPYIEIEEL